MTRLHVDTRYVGNHGIARYASEVIRRLDVEYTPYRPAGSPTAARAIFERDRRRISAGDVLYSPGYGAGPAACRQVVTVHDLIHLTSPNGGSLKYRLYYDHVLRPVIRRSGLVLTVSRTSRDAIIDWLGDDDVEVVSTGNGVSASFVPDGPQFEHGRPYFLFVGNTKRHKNLVTALRAMRELPEFDLVVVCPSDQDPLPLAREHGVGQQVVHRRGLTDEQLAELYRGAAALAYPSLIEGFGLPAAESLCSGTPVVYYAGCASVAEVCGPGQLSYDRPYDASAFAQQLARAADHPPDVARTDSYSWDAVATAVSRAIRSTLG